VTKFIERVFGTGIRPSDVFLVGYPKSGMTWMEFLLSHAVFEKRVGDWVTFRTINDYVPNLAGVGPGDALLLWPYYSRPKPRIFFTHTPFDARLANGKIIYMLRDPRDSLVSYYHYHKREEKNFHLQLGEFLRSEKIYPGHWDDHVRGWVLDHRELLSNIIVVRYEELRRDTSTVLSQVLDFIGISFTETDIRHAIEMSSFDRMRELEMKYPTGPKADSSERFVRKGKVGNWIEELSKADVLFIEQRYGEIMRQEGYL
jgi:hypothetical protein